jgi:hypothetical protein
MSRTLSGWEEPQRCIRCRATRGLWFWTEYGGLAVHEDVRPVGVNEIVAGTAVNGVR